MSLILERGSVAEKEWHQCVILGPRIRDVGQPNILVPLETRTIKNVRNQPRNTDIIFFCKPEGFFMLMLQHTDQAAQ